MTRQEKLVVIFLLITAAVGLAVRFYKTGHRPTITISPSHIAKEPLAAGHYTVNINTADEKQLASLDGIGPTLAKNIIAYRQKNGFFCLSEDLLKVPGIGQSKFDKIKNFIATQDEPR